MKKLTLIFAFFSLPFFVFSQMDSMLAFWVEDSILPELLPGDGVQILSWSFDGHTQSKGAFIDGESTIGIEHGIILSSGAAHVADSPNLSTSSGSSSGSGGDFDLELLAGTTTFDASIFTVEFIPLSDSMNFRFVFASEEYPEYVGSIVNDAFGFFVSGPGISGPFSNDAVNIALIPGTDDPITINSVNQNVNSQFFELNGDMPGSPNTFQPSGTQPTYDGLTHVLSATLEVVPIETYTMKIAVADAADGVFDSAVFLEGESFETCCDSIISNVSAQLFTAIPENGNTFPVSFDFSEMHPNTFPYSVSVSGMAEEGVDFQINGLPSEIVESQSSLEIGIDVLPDYETEGLEFFKIEFESQGGFKFPYYFQIVDGFVEPWENQIQCPDLSGATISAELPNPQRFYSFEREVGVGVPLNEASILVEDVPGDVLFDASLIESICVNIETEDANSIHLTLITPNGKKLELSTGNGSNCDNFENTCFSPSADTEIEDAIPFGYQCGPDEVGPFTGDFQPEGKWSFIEDTPLNGVWSLEGSFNGILHDWSITFDMGEEITPPTYLWSTGETTPEITVSPAETTTYSVSITHAGQTIVEETTVSADLEIANLEVSTSCDLQFYTVSFEIMGGDPTTYSVMPFSGFLTGNIFTSDPIPCGNGYLFIVNDGSGCGSAEVSSPEVTCECLTEAGQMDETPLTLCVGDILSVSYDSTSELYDCDDVTNFILHFGDLVPIAVSTTPEFETIGYGPGIAFFVTAVVGNDDGSGFVDFTDPCLAFSNSVEVAFVFPPNAAFMSNSYHSCESGNIEILVDLNGEAPWTLFFEVDGSPLPPVGGITDSLYLYTVAPDTSWVELQLVDVEDAYCSGVAFGLASIYVHPDPTMSLSSATTVCAGEFVPLQMSFTGAQPFDVVLEINGQTEQLTNLPSEFELLLEIEEDTEINLSNLIDNFGCTSTEVANLNIEALPAPAPEITSTSPVCPNTPNAIQIEFGGTAPYYVAYTIDGVLFFDSVPGNMLEFGSNIDEDVEFVLVSSVGSNGCSSGQSETVNISVIPPPVGSANFNGPLCPGFDLELMAEGGVNFEWSGPNGFASDEQMPTIENITADHIGDYTINVINECDDVDMVTLPVEFVCTSFGDTVLVGETGEICFDEIISSADLCDPVSAISVEINGNCLNFTGLSVGTETICLQVVLDGMETAVTVQVTSQMSTSVSELEAIPSLNVYPNPASENLVVSWKNTQVEQIEILDLTGRRLDILPTGSNPFEVPLLDLPEGSYLLRCHTTDGILVEKFIVLGR